MAEETIRVVTRVRPMLEGEQGSQFVRVVDDKQLEVHSLSNVQSFKYDAVMGMGATQDEVYDASCKNVLTSVLNGYNGAVIAYGQTSSGKTYTMTGTGGIVPKLTQELFKEICKRRVDDATFEVSCSYIQLYRERVYDMLSDGARQCALAQGEGLYLTNARNTPVEGVEDMQRLCEKGDANRIVHETEMNKLSSRSHAILLLTICSTTGYRKQVSQLYLVDLAGSECVGKSNAQGVVLSEASSINLSLLSLRRVITSLVKKAPHVPYRDSMLTRILESAIGGNSVTTIIICVSPSDFNQTETMSSLRFGLYTNSITNVATQNVVRSTEELEELIQRLYKEIEAALTTKRSLEAQVRKHQAVYEDETLFSGSGRLKTALVNLKDIDIPRCFICPLSGEMMTDPVTLSDGFSYDRHYATRYLSEYGRPPKKIAPCVTSGHLVSMIPNRALRGRIEAFVAEAIEVQKDRAW